MPRNYSVDKYAVDDDHSLEADFLASCMGISNMDCYFALQFKFDELEATPDYDPNKNYKLGKRE